MRCLFVILSLLVVSLIGTVAPAGGDDYSAIVMDVKGKTMVTHGGLKKAVDLGCLLFPGDEVETSAGASLTINYLSSGVEELWRGGMKFRVNKFGSTPDSAQVKKKKKIALPRIDSEQTGQTTLYFVNTETQGAQKSVASLSVRGLSNTSIVIERPAFRWYPVDAADTYRVTLYAEEKTVWQRVTGNNELPYPREEAVLQPGSRYEWVVEALAKGNAIAAKRSCFAIPSPDEFADLRQALNNHGAPMTGASGDSADRLYFILFLQKRQLYDDALEQYQLLKREHKNNESISNMEQNLLRIRNAKCPAM